MKIGMLITSALFSALAAVLFGGCGNDSGTKIIPPASATVGLRLVKTATLTTDTEGGSARPEVIATAERVYTIYLGHISGGMSTKTFDVKIYDAELSSVVNSLTIVPPSEEYGGATDIRIARDGQYVYVFYETSTMSTTYLHGAKYSLNDTFELVARAAEPIASAKPVFQTVEGDEILNDPAPLVGPESVFVVTRLMASISTSGNTVYRVREFNKETFIQIRQFDLDLSGIADGRGRVASLLYWNSSIYMALATTVSDQGLNEQNLMSDDGAQCDIILLTLTPDWTFDPQTDVRTISAEAGDRENYITGLRTDGTYFFMTYKQAVSAPPAGEQRAVIKIFDSGFTLLHKEIVRSVAWGESGGEIRPSLEVAGKRIYSGQDTSRNLGTGNAEVYVYDLR